MAGSKLVIQPAARHTPTNPPCRFAPGLFRMARRAHPLEIIEPISAALSNRNDVVQFQATSSCHRFGTTIGTPIRKVAPC